MLGRVKVHFALQAWDFLALMRKLLRDSLIASSPLCMGKVRKVMCLRGRRGALWHSSDSCFGSPLSIGKVRKDDVLGRVKVHFAWQAWDFVALKRKLLCDSSSIVFAVCRKCKKRCGMSWDV